jgi:hypothetical protein
MVFNIFAKKRKRYIKTDELRATTFATGEGRGNKEKERNERGYFPHNFQKCNTQHFYIWHTVLQLSQNQCRQQSKHTIYCSFMKILMSDQELYHTVQFP